MPLHHVNGVRLMAEIAGDGEPLLFLGGTGWDLRLHPNPLDSLLVRRFRVLLHDQRGMGRSDKPPGPYTMLDYATDALALLDDLGWQRVHVAGYSFGGMVAQELAIRWPDRVRSLVLAACTAGGEGGRSFPIETLLDLDPDERARRGLEIADLAFTAEWQACHPDEARARVESRVRRQTAFRDEPGFLDGLRAQLAARAGHDTWQRLPSVTAPTLVLAGDRDGQAPAGAVRALAARIPGAELRWLAGSHNFLFESDDAYRAIAAHAAAR